MNELYSPDYLTSIIGPRVAINTEDPPPSFESLDLQNALDQALKWQQRRSVPWFTELGAAIANHPGSRWILEILSLIGIIGEQVILASELEVEKVIVQRAIDNIANTDIYSNYAYYSRSLRFFAESQINAVVIALHGLANIAVRSLEFDKKLSDDELRARANR